MAKAAKLTVSNADALPPLSDALRLTEVDVVTKLVAIGKEAVDKPDAMLRVLDATTAVFELVRLSTFPNVHVEMGTAEPPRAS